MPAGEPPLSPVLPDGNLMHCPVIVNPGFCAEGWDRRVHIARVHPEAHVILDKALDQVEASVTRQILVPDLQTAGFPGGPIPNVPVLPEMWIVQVGGDA